MLFSDGRVKSAGRWPMMIGPSSHSMPHAPLTGARRMRWSRPAVGAGAAGSVCLGSAPQLQAAGPGPQHPLAAGEATAQQQAAAQEGLSDPAARATPHARAGWIVNARMTARR